MRQVLISLMIEHAISTHIASHELAFVVAWKGCSLSLSMWSSSWTMMNKQPQTPSFDHRLWFHQLA